MDKKQTAFLIAALVASVTVPYLPGWMTGGDWVFMGFLLNPIDGNTYLAKMQQGWAGAWTFHLPYAAEVGGGSLVNLFYLFLGHLARAVGLPVLAVYHAARVLGAGLLAGSLAVFFRQVVFPESPERARLAAWLAVFGAGMGWLAALAGLLPSDFWVAEAYPFLSSYVNPHFPTGLAILVGVLWMALSERRGWHSPALVAAGLLEAIILPFGLAVLALALAGWAAWTWVTDGRGAGLRAAMVPMALLLLGGPFLVYLVWVTQADPLLAAWNAQNVTPSPPLWDFVLSLSPAFLLAVPGAVQAARRPAGPAARLLVAWFVLGCVLVYAPFSLQRRFMTGLFIPTAALAVFGIEWVRARARQGGRWLVPVVLGLSLMTNLFLVLGGVLSVAGRSDRLFLSRAEGDALAWLQSEAAEPSLVLASPALGNAIPAYTRHRVIYGHPFETPNAGAEESQVKDFFSGAWTQPEMEAFLQRRGVDFVLVGERERALGTNGSLEPVPASLRRVYQRGAVTIYAVEAQP